MHVSPRVCRGVPPSISSHQFHPFGQIGLNYDVMIDLPSTRLCDLTLRHRNQRQKRLSVLASSVEGVYFLWKLLSTFFVQDLTCSCLLSFYDEVEPPFHPKLSKRPASPVDLYPCTQARQVASRSHHSQWLPQSVSSLQLQSRPTR